MKTKAALAPNIVRIIVKLPVYTGNNTGIPREIRRLPGLRTGRDHERFH
jgi:hypothetical protein